MHHGHVNERDGPGGEKAPPEPEWARFTGGARLLVMGNAFVAFAVELVLLGLVGRWALSLDLALWWRLPIAVGTILLLAAAWGVSVSPKARVRLPVPVTVAVKGVFFALGTAVLWEAGSPVAAIVFFALALSSAVFAAVVRANAPIR